MTILHAADPIPSGQPAWVYVILFLLSSGSAKFIYDTYKDWRSQPSRAVRESTDIDASIITVARARDELAEDNARLRQELVDQDDRHSRERNRWLADQERFRAQIRELEGQIRIEQKRYADLLLTVQALGRQVDQGMNTEKET